MTRDQKRIISGLSIPELVIWRALFGFLPADRRVSFQKRLELEKLADQLNAELGPMEGGRKCRTVA